MMIDNRTDEDRRDDEQWAEEQDRIWWEQEMRQEHICHNSGSIWNFGQIVGME
jgi:hypothetical protein